MLSDDAGGPTRARFGDSELVNYRITTRLREVLDDPAGALAPIGRNFGGYRCVCQDSTFCGNNHVTNVFIPVNNRPRSAMRV